MPDAPPPGLPPPRGAPLPPPHGVPLPPSHGAPLPPPPSPPAWAPPPAADARPAAVPPATWAYRVPAEPPLLTPLPPPRPTRRALSAPAVLLGVLAAVVSSVVVRVGLETLAPRSAKPVELHAGQSIGTSPPGWVAEFVSDTGDPARWDPCQPIHYTVNTTHMPTGGLADVKTAVQRIADASGLRFSYDGTTTEEPSRGRAAYQPDRYGARWAPVLIAWDAMAATDMIDDPAAQGITVPIAVGTPKGGVIISAQIQVSTDRLLPTGFGPGPSDGEVLVHELGHVIGLGHVNDPAQAMYPAARGFARFGDGDLRGLAAVGADNTCRPAPKAHSIVVHTR